MVLLLVLSLPPISYETWRYSVESEIQNKIAFENYPAAPVCAYVVSSSPTMDYFYGRVSFIEGGFINKTAVSDWKSVLSYSEILRDELLKTSQPCKMFFGLTRTLFVLLFDMREDPRLLTTVDLVYSQYAPF